MTFDQIIEALHERFGKFGHCGNYLPKNISMINLLGMLKDLERKEDGEIAAALNKDQKKNL